MKPSKLIALVLAAAVLVALAVVSSHRRHPAPPAAIGKAVLPGLDLEAVSRIEIARTGAPIAIQHADDGWQVANLAGYPADIAKLRTDLLKLKDLKVGDVARGISLDTNAVTLVDIQDASGKPVATLRLGQRPSRGGSQSWRAPEGRYVSVAGDPKVYLVKESLDDFDGDAKTWVDAQLLNLSASDIQSIELSSPTGQVVTLSRETGSLQLQGIATNEEFDTSKSYGIESACSYLNFTGVADPKLTDAQTGLAAPHFYRVHLKSGDSYTARIGASVTNGTDRFMRLSFELAPPGTNATLKAEQEKRKADLEPKFGKWTYLVAASTAENMMRTRAELVKPKVVATNETASATSTNTPATVP